MAAIGTDGQCAHSSARARRPSTANTAVRPARRRRTQALSADIRNVKRLPNQVSSGLCLLMRGSWYGKQNK